MRETLTLRQGFGLATLPDTPATPETLYYTGSTTKAYTAATLAHLIDSKIYPELALGWSTPFSSIIRDDFVLQDEWSTNHVTLDDAASHRTGLTGHDNAWHRDRNGNKSSVRDVVRNLRNLPLKKEPRVAWDYCNMMYITLSHVIETVTGKRLGDLMKELIWKPLGMNTTYLTLREAQDASAHLALSYVWRDREEKYDELLFASTEAFGGAGGIISSVVDYAKWIQCLIHEAEPFSKAVHKDIRTPRVIDTPLPGYNSDVSLYGLGWSRTTIHGEVVYSHDGSTISYGAEVYWFPNIKYGIVAFANGAMTSNAAETILVQNLIEDRLKVPTEDRVDVNKRCVQPTKLELSSMTDVKLPRYKQSFAQTQHNLEHADEILFPTLPKRPLPPTAKTAELAGTYYDSGYGTFTLFQEPHPDKLDETILVANRDELVFGQQWRLHHASGNFWTMYGNVTFCNINKLTEFHAAEFKFGVDGKATGLQVDMNGRGRLVARLLFEKVK